ncbi:hypothetical protein PLICRDRAFT_643132 [Plicaturopsis crispa FD-325 SS-3]|nr:hypothetical protein PLICRDRAFT_643132 [Plicaturopsis crispa FD-325 SS-3]
MFGLPAEVHEIQVDLRAARREQQKRAVHNKETSRWVEASRYAPLVAALLAPLSTIYDIPALSQRWYVLSDGTQVPDPKASLILSAVGLAFNVGANTLLALRFSSSNRRWRIATVLSLALWIAKTILAVVNLSIFGTRQGSRADLHYTEGFWCAVISVCTAGIICILLIFHAVLNLDEKKRDNREVRAQGQHFMLSVMWLFSIVALEALVMSHIEHWAYFDGIYFSVVTMFTIGIGDFAPTQKSSQILLFPFAIITIAALANQISIIVGFIAARASQRKESWHALYDSLQTSKQRLRKTTDLEKEMRFLQTLARREGIISKMYDLSWSLAGFVVFWACGAAIFCAVEGWAYGTSVYFTYIVLLTIGYGDNAPSTPAGRCLFVLYALMAVPVVASFAVQTVTSIFSAIAERHLENRKGNEGLEPSLKPAEKAIEQGEERESEEYFFVSHATFVERAHKKWKETHSIDHDSSAEEGDRVAEKDEELDRYLTDRVLKLAVELEDISRTLLIDHLKPGSKERMLLRADRNLQQRDTMLHDAEDADGKEDHIGDVLAAGTDSTLEQIRQYRSTFASLLATGSRLKRLQGEERYIFERRRKPERGSSHMQPIAEEQKHANA